MTHARTLALLAAGSITLAVPAMASARPADPPACCGSDKGQTRIYEDRANTFTGNLQDNAVLAAAPDGQFLTLWDSRRQDDHTYGIFAQRYDAIGRPVGTEIHLNQYVPSTQRDPAAAFSPDGVAWTTWESLGQDGSQNAVVLRRFRMSQADLVPLGEEVIANQTTQGDQFDPAIAINADGTALLTWSARNDDNSITVIGRMFNADSTPAGDEFAISGTLGSIDRIASAAALGNGHFAVVWARTDSRGRPGTILARLIDDHGQAATDEMIVSGSDTGENIEPSITAAGDAGFAVAWFSAKVNNSNGYDLLLRRFSNDAAPAGQALLVAAPETNWLSGLAITGAADGRVLVSWNEEGRKVIEMDEGEPEPITRSRIVARIVSSDNRTLGPAFQINQENDGRHALAIASNATRLFWDGADTIAAAWTGTVKDDLNGIGITVKTPTSLNPEAPAPVKRVAALVGPADAAAGAPPIRDPNWKPEERDAGVQSQGPDFGFLGYMRTEWIPPDPDIAAGPNHVVIVCNMRVAVFTHEGQEVFHEYLEDFFRGQGSNNFVFDPVAVWDSQARRFVIASAERNGAISRLVIAVSKTENPLDGWNKYGFNTNNIGSDIDFENLGVGPDAYYITADYFGGQGNYIHIFEKAPMLIGDPVTLRYIRTSTSLISLGAVNSYDANEPAQYFASSWPNRSAVRIYALRNPFSNPTLTTVDMPVPYMSDPPDATQRGSSNRVSTIDRRIKNGVLRNGHLFISHTIGEDNTARVRWYEFDMRGWPTSGNNPTMIQMGTLNDGSGQHNWFPDIGVDADGDLVLTTSRSSSNDYPYIARNVRKAGDPDGSFRPYVRLQESAGPTNSGRWGDYSGIDEDPDVPGVFWSHNEYTAAGDSWRTWVGRVNTDRGMVLSVDQVQRGANSTLTVSNCTPGDPVYFAYSLGGLQETYVPFIDVNIGLRNAQLIGTRNADAGGQASLTTFVPNGAPMRSIWIQAAQNRNSSNVVEEFIN